MSNVIIWPFGQYVTRLFELDPPLVAIAAN